jgi:hypothetical protein
MSVSTSEREAKMSGGTEVASNTTNQADPKKNRTNKNMKTMETGGHIKDTAKDTIRDSKGTDPVFKTLNDYEEESTKKSVHN